MPDESARSTRGALRTILVATVIAGGLGYLIQAAVPMFAPDSYLGFATLWSAVYLVVSSIAGIQQEITRAARRGAGSGSGRRTWGVFTLFVTGASAVIVASVFAVLGARIFPESSGSLVTVVVVAAIGYCLVASISGVLYGVQDWTGVGAMTVSDSILRAIAVALALLLGGGVVALGWATAVPFLASAALLWWWRGRPATRDLELDVGFGVLLRNSAATLVASLAMGIMISGLPLVLRALVDDAGQSVLASLILVLTLTRAPLVVPLVALQGYLIVRMRDAQGSLFLTLVRWLGIVLATVCLIAALAWWLGPLLLELLYPNFFVDGFTIAAIVLSAGLTGALCVTGAATLARARHRWYVAGWLCAAITTIAILISSAEAVPRVLLALVLAPAAGLVIHTVGVLRSPEHGSAPSS